MVRTADNWLDSPWMMLDVAFLKFSLLLLDAILSIFANIFPNRPLS